MIDWDARYAEAGFAYGTEPNDFLAQSAHTIPRGRVLCLAEGQGRNAVHLAGLGYDVTAVDLSRTGLERGLTLAESRGVRITTVVSDLADYVIEPAAWSGIVSIFAHMPPELRRKVHRGVVAGLMPGGVLVLEAFAPRQIELDTGGPDDIERLMTAEGLRRELAGLEWIVAHEIERDVIEGRCHTGAAFVVQMLGRKP